MALVLFHGASADARRGGGLQSTAGRTAPNYLLETNRRPASPLGAGQKFLHSVHAQARASGGGRSANRWASHLVYMRVWILIYVVSALLLGCATSKDPIGAQGVDIAVNLGFERERESDQIQSALVSAGIACNQRAMSCNEAPLVVRPGDFERARAIATETVIRNSLTVRLFKSPSGLSSLLEVWEDGRKIREEPHKLYPLSDDTIKSINAWNSTRKDQPK